MRRKEQEARIEQQRQEKEKAREDAARERARCADIQPHHDCILRIHFVFFICDSNCNEIQ